MVTFRNRRAFVDVGGLILRLRGSTPIASKPFASRFDSSPNSVQVNDFSWMTNAGLRTFKRRPGEARRAYPEVPIVYCSGQPSDETLAILARLVNDADEVLIATDADLGGVRIAKRLLGALTDGRATVLDVGAAPHAEGRPFGGAARQLLEDLSAETGRVGLFAQACLDRGYQVEQEAVIRAVVTAALDQHP